MKLSITDGQTILFIGDSITDCGRRDSAPPLGSGYVKLFADLATIREPEKRITVINKGIGGDRVTGLRNRWTDDVLGHDIAWLSVKIGINDLHSSFYQQPDSVTPAVFRAAYEDILSRTKAARPACRILLIDPFYISTDRAETSFRRQVLDLLPEYIGIVHEMSERFGARLVKTHEIFQRLLRYYEADAFCPEPVHPNLTGHLTIADAVYAALCD